jgi:hypothetical protein
MSAARAASAGSKSNLTEANGTWNRMARGAENRISPGWSPTFCAGMPGGDGPNGASPFLGPSGRTHAYLSPSTGHNSGIELFAIEAR